MLAELELSGAELSVLLTDDPGIRVLNREHRQKDKPTDVLSFPLDETEGPEAIRLLGDVVISVDTAERQARSRRRGLLEEVRFLLAHGILHLIGYDHATRPQKKRMDAACRKLCRAASLPPERVVRRPVKHAKRRTPPSKKLPR
jgi:probable rRNA maturation factor